VLLLSTLYSSDESRLFGMMTLSGHYGECSDGDRIIEWTDDCQYGECSDGDCVSDDCELSFLCFKGHSERRTQDLADYRPLPRTSCDNTSSKGLFHFTFYFT